MDAQAAIDEAFAQLIGAGPGGAEGAPSTEEALLAELDALTSASASAGKAAVPGSGAAATIASTSKRREPPTQAGDVQGLSAPDAAMSVTTGSSGSDESVAAASFPAVPTEAPVVGFAIADEPGEASAAKRQRVAVEG